MEINKVKEEYAFYKADIEESIKEKDAKIKELSVRYHEANDEKVEAQ